MARKSDGDPSVTLCMVEGCTRAGRPKPGSVLVLCRWHRGRETAILNRLRDTEASLWARIAETIRGAGDPATPSKPVPP